MVWGFGFGEVLESVGVSWIDGNGKVVEGGGGGGGVCLQSGVDEGFGDGGVVVLVRGR